MYRANVDRTGSGIRNTWVFAAVIALLSLTTSPSFGVRPFVTDDARIADYGQIEAETWLEIVRGDGYTSAVYHGFLNVVPTDWLELGASAGFGRDTDGRGTVANSSLQGKVLLWQPVDGAFPGIAVVGGVVLPYGSGGAFRDALGSYVIAPVTLSLANERLLLHGNVGFTAASDDTHTFDARAFWGLGADVGLFHPDWRLVAEGFAGDPEDARGPRYAGQFGFRWLASDHVNLDVSTVVAPEVDERGRRLGGTVWSGQFGLRVLFDTFTRHGRPGSPAGAPGWFGRPPGFRG